MSAGTVILLVLVLVLIAVITGLGSTLLHRQAGRRLGADFTRRLRQTGPWKARSEFAERRRRVDGLGIKPLSADRRAGYARQWMAAQERFIDSPQQATSTAAALVTAVAAERGYDVSDERQLLVDLSVYHGRYLDGHRRATQATAPKEASTGGASTEELRQALLGHRALFRDLLGVSGDGSAPNGNSRVRAGRVPRLPWRRAAPALNRPVLDRAGTQRGYQARAIAIGEDTRR